MSYRNIQFDIQAGIARLTFNRPERMNSVSGEMNREIRDVLARLANGRGVKTINEISQMYSVHPTQVGLWKKIQSPLQNYSGVANYGDRNILETSTITGSHVAQLTEF